MPFLGTVSYVAPGCPDSYLYHTCFRRAFGINLLFVGIQLQGVFVFGSICYKVELFGFGNTLLRSEKIGGECKTPLVGYSVRYIYTCRAFHIFRL